MPNIQSDSQVLREILERLTRVEENLKRTDDTLKKTQADMDEVKKDVGVFSRLVNSSRTTIVVLSTIAGFGGFFVVQWENIRSLLKYIVGGDSVG